MVRDLVITLMRANTRTTERIAELGALAVVSALVRRRAYVRLPHEKVFPNLWGFYIARSGVFGKTTLHRFLRRMVESVEPSALLPEVMTPEGLLSALAENAKRVYLVNEASQIFALARKDYQSGWSELLLRLHDCEDRFVYAPKTKELRSELREVYIAALFSSTPSAMASYIADEVLWRNGLFGRFLFAYETTPPPYARPEEVEDELAEHVEALRRLNAALENRAVHDGGGVEVVLSPEASGLFWDYDREVFEDLTRRDESPTDSAFVRKPTQALRIATLYALLDWGCDPTWDAPPVIQRAHLAAAIEFAESAFADAQRIFADAEAIRRGNHDAAIRERILGVLGEVEGNTLTRRELARRVGLYGVELDRVIDGLIRDELIAVQKTTAKNGEPSLLVTLRG